RVRADVRLRKDGVRAGLEVERGNGDAVVVADRHGVVRPMLVGGAWARLARVALVALRAGEARVALRAGEALWALLVPGEHPLTVLALRRRVGRGVDRPPRAGRLAETRVDDAASVGDRGERGRPAGNDDDRGGDGDELRLVHWSAPFSECQW